MRPHSRDIPGRGRGFTLIEIMATLVLVAIVLPVVMKGVAMCLETSSASRHQTEAAALAQTKLADILTEAQWQNTTQSGDFAPDNPDYNWTAQVSTWDVTTIKQVDVEVTWRQQGQVRNMWVSTLVYTGTAQ